MSGVDKLANPNDGFSRCDICDPAITDLIPENATIVHLAAISRDPDCRQDPRLAFEINVGGTLNLATAAARRNAKQFIFASSEWVYGEVGNDKTQLENQAIDMTTMKSEYAISKLTAEQLLRLNTALKATTILRFGIVYGPRPGNWSALELLCDKVTRREKISIGSRGTARRFIHVDDICTGIVACIGRPAFQIYNLSGDTLLSLGEIIDVASRITSINAEVVETAPDRPSIRNPENARARLELNWRPSFGPEKGLANILEYLANRQNVS